MIDSFGKWLRLPMDASAHGQNIDFLIVFTHWMMFALFIGWGIFFVFVLIRFRKSKNPKANYKGVKSHASSYLEVAIAIIEAILLIGFSIPLWSERVNAFPPEENSTVVRVTGEQFAWNIHYPGADGKFGNTDVQKIDVQSNPVGLDYNDPAAKDDVVTVNQLHLPVDKPVIIHLSSKDVIHSFGVPLLRVKQDAVPGMSIPLWFEPKKEGQFEIVCSQLCGLGHYRMRGYIHVESEENYRTWLQNQAKASSGGSGDDFWN